MKIRDGVLLVTGGVLALLSDYRIVNPYSDFRISWLLALLAGLCWLLASWRSFPLAVVSLAVAAAHIVFMCALAVLSAEAGPIVRIVSAGVWVTVAVFLLGVVAETRRQ